MCFRYSIKNIKINELLFFEMLDMCPKEFLLDMCPKELSKPIVILFYLCLYNTSLHTSRNN